MSVNAWRWRVTVSVAGITVETIDFLSLETASAYAKRREEEIQRSTRNPTEHAIGLVPIFL